MKKIGICFVTPAPLVKPEDLTTAARKCEELGLHSFWVIDRIAYDNLEPLSVLATVAAVTRNLRIGTSVLLAALRHPALLAKTVSTVDLLSGGRITLGIGFGSRESDFTAVDLPYEGRGSRAEEAVKLMKKIWTGEKVSHQGRFFKVEDLSLGPLPRQKPHPPIWMGGNAESALRRVARMADGYICGSSAISDFPTLWEKISGYAQKAGRKSENIEKAGLTFMAIDDNKGKAVDACAAYLTRYYGQVRFSVEDHLVVGSATDCAERINSNFDKGLDTLIIGQVIPDLRQLDLFGEKVLPRIRS